MRSTNSIYYHKGESGCSTLIGSVIIISIIIWGFTSFFGGESDGEVKYDDCRQIINVQKDSWNTYFKKFVCHNIKSNSGKLLVGTCVNIETQNGICTKAYIYNKKPEVVCGNNSHPDINDKCYCDYGFMVDLKNNNLCTPNSITPTIKFQDNPYNDIMNGSTPTAKVIQPTFEPMGTFKGLQSPPPPEVSPSIP